VVVALVEAEVGAGVELKEEVEVLVEVVAEAEVVVQGEVELQAVVGVEGVVEAMVVVPDVARRKVMEQVEVGAPGKALDEVQGMVGEQELAWGEVEAPVVVQAQAMVLGTLKDQGTLQVGASASDEARGVEQALDRPPVELQRAGLRLDMGSQLDTDEASASVLGTALDWRMGLVQDLGLLRAHSLASQMILVLNGVLLGR